MITSNFTITDDVLTNDSSQDELRLACTVCGFISKKELRFDSIHERPGYFGMFTGATEVAYPDFCVDWKENSDQIKAGLETTVTVHFPVYCRVGDCFNLCYGEKFITARLKSILSAKVDSAEVMITVVKVKGPMDFIKPLSNAQIDELKGKRYDKKVFPKGDAGYPTWRSVGERCLEVSNTDFQGDAGKAIYIYTDDAGVDHLFKSSYDIQHLYYCFFGDKVIGRHKELKLVNGLVINKRSKTLIGCFEDVKDIHIPNWVRTIDSNVFEYRVINTLYIPASVTSVKNNAPWNWEYVKRIILEGRVKPSVEKELRRCCTNTEIIRKAKE